MDERFRWSFPKLSNVRDKQTSPIDPRYNCIAWAFEDSRRHWWPKGSRSFWPLNTTGKTSMEAFEEWFAVNGWEITESAAFEEGYVKIALFAKDGEPKHASRQLSDRKWTSKLGQDIDITHQLDELDGPTYGSVIRIYKKLR